MTKSSEEEFQERYLAAVRRGLERSKFERRALSASYDAGSRLLTIELENGSSFSVPSYVMREFDGATADEIAQVEITAGGSALHWEKIDQDFSIDGLIASGLGSESPMAQLGRKGGRVQSDVKALAARANGLKGGRPKKEPMAAAITYSFNLPGTTLSIADTEVLRAGLIGSSHMATIAVAEYEQTLIQALKQAQQEYVNTVLEGCQFVVRTVPGSHSLTGKTVVHLASKHAHDVVEKTENADLALAA